jgi:hypothetical protein
MMSRRPLSLSSETPSPKRSRQACRSSALTLARLADPRVRYESFAIVQVNSFLVADFGALMIAFKTIETIARRPVGQSFDLKAVHLMLGRLIPTTVHFDMNRPLIVCGGVQVVLLWSDWLRLRNRAQSRVYDTLV